MSGDDDDKDDDENDDDDVIECISTKLYDGGKCNSFKFKQFRGSDKREMRAYLSLHLVVQHSACGHVRSKNRIIF